jgi:hypothetical protein
VPPKVKHVLLGLVRITITVLIQEMSGNQACKKPGWFSVDFQAGVLLIFKLIIKLVFC